jgi:hypothetical protein
MSSKSLYLTSFNNHFFEFLDDIISIFPDDADLLSAKNAALLFRKANPKIIIQIWNNYVVGKYQEMINQGNIEFFINKDYSNDLANTKHAEKIVDVINRLREPVKKMGPEDQKKAMKYIQNLTKLSTLYTS